VNAAIENQAAKVNQGVSREPDGAPLSARMARVARSAPTSAGSFVNTPQYASAARRSGGAGGLAARSRNASGRRAIDDALAGSFNVGSTAGAWSLRASWGW